MDFTLNLFGRKLNDGIRDLAAMLRLWKRDVRVFIDKKTLTKFKKVALTNSEFEKYGHIRIESSINIEIIYDLNSLEIVQLDIEEQNSNKKVYIPYKKTKRQLFIISQKKK